MSNTVITDLFGHSPNPRPNKPETESDLEFAKQNIRNQILQTEDALNELMMIMKQSQHPAAYAAYTVLAREYIEANHTLLKSDQTEKKTRYIEKKTAELSDERPRQINNNLFVGSTKDALQMIKAKKEQQDE